MVCPPEYISGSVNLNLLDIETNSALLDLKKQGNVYGK
jgi:hypothetical protein